MNDNFQNEKKRLYSKNLIWGENKDIIFEYADKYYDKIKDHNQEYLNTDIYFVCLIISKKFIDDDSFYLTNHDYIIFKKIDIQSLNNLEIFCLKKLDYSLFICN
jgi:hypothetical protein